MQLTPDEQNKSHEATEWVKTHIEEIFQVATNGRNYTGISTPAAAFMAGTPGAGKTEISKVLIESFDIPL